MGFGFHYRKVTLGLPSWSSGRGAALPMQGARVWSLDRELDHTCRNKKILCATTRTQHSQINNQYFKKDNLIVLKWDEWWSPSLCQSPHPGSYHLIWKESLQMSLGYTSHSEITWMGPNCHDRCPDNDIEEGMRMMLREGPMEL